MTISTVKQPELRHSLLSGAVAQSVEIAFGGHLLERMKVELQSNPQLRSIRQAVQHMYAQGGMKEIYKGLRWNFVAGISKGTTRWGVYSGFYGLYEKILPEEWQRKAPALVSASVGISGALLATTFVICPLGNLKTREMTMKGGKEGLWKIIHQEGLPFFFHGWHRTLLKQCFSLSSYLVTFEKLKQLTQIYNEGAPATLVQKMGVSGSAGMVSCLFHTPLDMMITQAQKENPLVEKRFFAAVRLLYSQYGVAGFYRSLNVKLIRSGWHAAVTLGVMDLLDALPKQMKI